MGFAMKPDVMDKLFDARDFYALTRSILSLCEPFGQVHSFRFTHNRGASRVACLIELEELKQHAPLAQAIGGTRINGAVCVEIPVRKDFGSLAKLVAVPKMPAPAVEQRIAQG